MGARTINARDVTVDAVITYGWCRTSYSALRSLHRAGLRVAVVDSYRTGMCQFSRFPAVRRRVPDHRARPAAYVGAVGAITTELRAGFLLPGHDDARIWTSSENRAILYEGARTILPTRAAYDGVDQKDRVTRLARELGISVPATVTVGEPNDVLALPDGPVLVKPTLGHGAKGIRVFRDQSAAAEWIRTSARHGPRSLVAQELVPGGGWGVSMLYHEGRPIGTFTHRRLQEKTLPGGTSTLREARRHTPIERDARRLLDAVGWNGVAMVEFRVDGSTGKHWLLEVNPRLWGSLDLAVASGADFPLAMYYAATGDHGAAARVFERPWQEGHVSRWVLGQAIRRVGGQRGAKPAGPRPPSRSDDDLRWDDPAAFAGECVHYVSGFLRTRSINP